MRRYLSLSAVRLNPSFAEAHSNLGLLSLKKGDTDAAAEHARAALRIIPDLPECLCILSVALILKEESPLLGEAVELAQKAVALRPQLPQAHAILGIAYGTAGRNSEAETELKKALDLMPDSLEVHLSLAVLYKKTGRADRAEFHISRIARIDPDFFAKHNIQSDLNVAKLRTMALLEGGR